LPRTSGPLQALTGVVQKVLYCNDETGYVVCTVAQDGRRDPVTVVGTCPGLCEGENVRAEGSWVRHKQHGLQFQTTALAAFAPVTLEGIRRYLASGAIRGVGPVTAERIVAQFGERTLDVIDRESKRLEEVEGIGRRKREQIKQSWNEQKAVREIMVFLQSHGIGSACALRIFKQYGESALGVVRQDPYRLSREVWGIGFKTADRLAMNLGVSPQADMRARAGLAYLLQSLEEEGHCFCPREELLPAAEDLLQIPTAILEQALQVELANGALVDDSGRVYLPELYGAERGVAAAVRRMAAGAPAYPPIRTEAAVEWAERRMGVRFSPEQGAALRMAMASKLSIITGGPGVGKTTIVRALVDVFRARKLRTVLAAPTGRAAKRLEESTRAPASTLHRLLKFTPGTGAFEHNSQHPVEGDVFILDEVSMMDLALTHAFLRALPGDATLVLVGDADQLPSVGPGNVLRDLIASGVVPVTHLRTIYRQESRSWIVHNAHRVNRGESLDLAPRGAASDFHFIQADDPDAVIRTMLDLVQHRIPARFGFDPRRDIQVLSPMRRYQLGSDNLNAVLQQALNPEGAALQRYGRQYKAGDRVLQVRNNYDKDVFNGDMGLLKSIDLVDQKVVVLFDGRPVEYELTELDELDLAYACSVHKSQGSEYPAVVLLMTTQHYRLLQRNLLYTALTRGRKLVCLVGSPKAVHIAIGNDHVAQRRTYLRERLAGT
jgi:exodeoxyribonuclease V alpha subunit